MSKKDSRNVPGLGLGGTSGGQALGRSEPVRIQSLWIRTGLEQELEHRDVELTRRAPERRHPARSTRAVDCFSCS
ncbi:hypothetical protein STIAU_2568, partial [Stigmatella aurantiaca DW4/3-1]